MTINDAGAKCPGNELLRLIAEDSSVTFQTFDEVGNRRELTRILHGSLDEHRQELQRLNREGAGVFFMVNRGDGKGRRATNVVGIRAVFADLDGAPLEPVRAFTLPPHAIVETSPGRYHAYWKVEGVTIPEFSVFQARIAKMFEADCKVKDAPRVMRVPGFEHRKGDGFKTALLTSARHPAYTKEQLEVAFGEVKSSEQVTSRIRSVSLQETIPEGERNQTLFGLARGLVNKGFAQSEIQRRIQRVNAERCVPPLCASEVDELIHNACEHGVRGSIRLPVAVYDSLAFRRLSHPARTVVLGAYRRFTGENNGNIALTIREFEFEFTRKQSFYNARREAVASGLIRISRRGRYLPDRGGREADLYEIELGPASVPTEARLADN